MLYMQSCSVCSTACNSSVSSSAHALYCNTLYYCIVLSTVLLYDCTTTMRTLGINPVLSILQCMLVTQMLSVLQCSVYTVAQCIVACSICSHAARAVMQVMQLIQLSSLHTVYSSTLSWRAAAWLHILYYWLLYYCVYCTTYYCMLPRMPTLLDLANAKLSCCR